MRLVWYSKGDMKDVEVVSMSKKVIFLSVMFLDFVVLVVMGSIKVVVVLFVMMLEIKNVAR